MKTLEDQMAFYAYHQDARNKATHFGGIVVALTDNLARVQQRALRLRAGA